MTEMYRLQVCLHPCCVFVVTGNMIAHKFRITNPQDYGLYMLVMGMIGELALCS